MKSTNDRVIVRMLEAETKTAGGLELPDSLKSQELAEVVAVCENWSDLQAEELNVGDIVVIAPMAGTDFVLDGAKYKSVNHKEVLLAV